MERDVWSCNTYNYGDGLYWDARYVQDALSFDWYLLYSSFRPFVRSFVPTSSRVLMVGCGNSLMSEDMVKDGYEDIMNVDISSVAIEMMRTKHASVPQLKYMQMDVRDMSYFEDESFDTVIDKGTLDSLMCGKDAPLSASRMLGEVSRLIKPGGTYFLITYGDPKVRMPHLTPSAYNWNISLYILPKLPLLLFLQWYETALFALSPFHFVAERPGFKKPGSRSSSAAKSRLEAIPLTSEGMLPHDYVLEDPDSHFIYICNKKG